MARRPASLWSMSQGHGGNREERKKTWEEARQLFLEEEAGVEWYSFGTQLLSHPGMKSAEEMGVHRRRSRQGGKEASVRGPGSVRISRRWRPEGAVRLDRAALCADSALLGWLNEQLTCSRLQRWNE